MTKDKPVKNVPRQDLQNCVYEIEALNAAAQAIHGKDDTEGVFHLLDMMEARTKWLNRALDSVNAPKVAS